MAIVEDKVKNLENRSIIHCTTKLFFVLVCFNTLSWKEKRHTIASICSIESILQISNMKNQAWSDLRETNETSPITCNTNTAYL